MTAIFGNDRIAPANIFPLSKKVFRSVFILDPDFSLNFKYPRNRNRIITTHDTLDNSFPPAGGWNTDT